jgi:hypothetical protein
MPYGLLVLLVLLLQAMREEWDDSPWHVQLLTLQLQF